jgi:hypothetical protein
MKKKIITIMIVFGFFGHLGNILNFMVKKKVSATNCITIDVNCITIEGTSITIN